MFWVLTGERVPGILLPYSSDEHVLPNNSETQAELQIKANPWTQAEQNRRIIISPATMKLIIGGNGFAL